MLNANQREIIFNNIEKKHGYEELRRIRNNLERTAKECGNYQEFLIRQNEWLEKYYIDYLNEEVKVEKDILIKEILSIINSHSGIKSVDLVVEVSPYTVNDIDIQEVLAELVKDGRIIEVEYILKSMDYKVKSIYFPMETNIRIKEKTMIRENPIIVETNCDISFRINDRLFTTHKNVLSFYDIVSLAYNNLDSEDKKKITNGDSPKVIWKLKVSRGEKTSTINEGELVRNRSIVIHEGLELEVKYEK